MTHPENILQIQFTGKYTYVHVYGKYIIARTL